MDTSSPSPPPSAPNPSPTPLGDGSLSDAQQEAAAYVALEETRRANPLFFYKASGKIAPFHQSRAITRLLVGANRSGKTESLCAETAAYALGYRPWVLRELGLPMPNPSWIRPANLPVSALCFNGADIRVQVPAHIMVLSGQSLKKGAGETLGPKLQKLLGPAIKKTTLIHAGTPGSITLKNDSVIHFGSDEQDSTSHEGTAYAFIGVDEPIKRSTYVALRRGSIDHFAPICFAFTPLGASANWMFRDLYAKAGHDPRIFAISVSIYDNEYLTPEAIAEFANDPAISDVEKEARLHGRFQNLIDRIHPTFNEEHHVLPGWRPHDSLLQVCILDPHSIRPWALAWAAITPRGEVVFFREWPATDFTKIRREPRSFESYATLIRSLEGPHPADVRLIDPNYGPRKDTLRGVSVGSTVEELAKYGLHFHYRLNDDLEYGERCVNQLLSFDRSSPLTALNRPRLFVTDDCPNIISALLFYTARYAQNSERPDELKRDETYKDFADVVRYLAVSDLLSHTGQDAEPFREEEFSGDSSYES